MTRHPAAVCLLLLGSSLPAASQVTGTATGITPSGLNCRNLSTGQSIVSVSGETSWDCEALGLLLDPGDRLQLGVRGVLPSPGASGPLRAGSLPEDFASHLLQDFVSLDGGMAIPGDMDGDGDTDVTASNDLLWFENLGGPDPAFAKHLFNGPIETASVHALIDVDLDQRLDVVAGYSVGGTLLWFRNQGGSPPTFESQPIDQRQGGWTTNAIDGGDLDGDGDVDFFVLMNKSTCCEEEVLWYENVGGAYVRHLIEHETLGSSSWIFAFDADGDEDLDLIYADFVDETLSWFENQDGTFTQKHELHLGSFFFFGIGHGDLDADGDEDLVAYERNANELQWLENLGEGSYAAARGIEVLPGHDFTGISVADFSADGRPDILLGDQLDVLTWLENLGGSPPAFLRHTASVQNRTAYPMAGDIDGDGRLDVVDVEVSKFVWQENQIGLRLSVTGLDLRSFRCRNRTTGQTVGRQGSDTEIDCESEGLTVSPGDEIEVFARGQAQ